MRHMLCYNTAFAAAVFYLITAVVVVYSGADWGGP
jgi:hypothetical protein